MPVPLKTLQWRFSFSPSLSFASAFEQRYRTLPRRRASAHDRLGRRALVFHMPAEYGRPRATASASGRGARRPGKGPSISRPSLLCTSPLARSACRWGRTGRGRTAQEPLEFRSMAPAAWQDMQRTRRELDERARCPSVAARVVHDSLSGTGRASLRLHGREAGQAAPRLAGSEPVRHSRCFKTSVVPGVSGLGLHGRTVAPPPRTPTATARRNTGLRVGGGRWVPRQYGSRSARHNLEM